MRNNILKNYEAFYDMVLMTTMLSNDMNEALEKDSKKIIDFIGEAYCLSNESIKECEDIIINELSILATMVDVETYIKSPDFEILDKNLADLYGIKCDVLSAMSSIGHGNAGGRWFDYGHIKTYSPEVRFSQMKKTAITRSLAANKLTAIMQYLGIGTEVDLESAIIRLKQCSIWGDMVSINLLKCIFKKTNDKEYCTYEELSKLDKYLYEGRTILPENVAKDISDEAKQLYVIISSIRQDIVYANNIQPIDYSFVEVMLLPSVDYYKKLYFINQYGINNQEWKEITNSSNNPRQRFGFEPRRED